MNSRQADNITPFPGRSGMDAVARLAWLAAVACDKSIPGASLRVAVALACRQNQKTGQLNPSAGTIARETSLSIRGVRKALRQLSDTGFLEVSSSSGGARQNTSSYRLSMPQPVNNGAPVNHGSGVNNDSPVNSGSARGEHLFPQGMNGGSPKQGIEQGREQRKGARTDYPAEFEETWKAYPTRTGTNSKKEAFDKWSARLKAGHTPESMLAGVKRYARHCQATKKTGTDYVMQAKRFFGTGEHFLEPWTSGASTTATGGPCPEWMEDLL